MIGLILVTHGRLAEEFISAMEHVVGAQDRVEPICIAADDDMELRRADIAATVREAAETLMLSTAEVNRALLRALIAARQLD